MIQLLSGAGWKESSIERLHLTLIRLRLRLEKELKLLCLNWRKTSGAGGQEERRGFLGNGMSNETQLIRGFRPGETTQDRALRLCASSLRNATRSWGRPRRNWSA